MSYNNYNIYEYNLTMVRRRGLLKLQANSNATVRVSHKPSLVWGVQIVFECLTDSNANKHADSQLD